MNGARAIERETLQALLPRQWPREVRLSFVDHVVGFVECARAQSAPVTKADARPELRAWARRIERAAGDLLGETAQLTGAQRLALLPFERRLGELRYALSELATVAAALNRDPDLVKRGPDNEEALWLVELLASLWVLNGLGRPAPEGNFGRFARVLGSAFGVTISARTIRAAIRAEQ